MLYGAINLDRIHCHEESDNWYSSEPYLWTVFFHADINTATLGPGNRIATYTPVANWTTRGMYPDGVQEGDDIDIPAELGERSYILDDGGLGLGVAGVLFVLLEQAQTPGDAISAGHEALAEATDVARNDYVDSRFPEIAEPSSAKIQAIAAQIQAEVTDAIRGELSWQHVLHDHDDFIGFGYKIATYEELSSLASGPPAEKEFSTRIRRELPLRVNEYEVFGRVSAQEHFPPGDPCGLEVYEAAVEAFDTVRDRITQIRGELQKASDPERAALLTELGHLKTTLGPEAARGIASARTAYELCRDRLSPSSAAYVEAKKRLKKAREDRIARVKPSGVRESAVVAPPVSHSRRSRRQASAERRAR